MRLFLWFAFIVLILAPETAFARKFSSATYKRRLAEEEARTGLPSFRAAPLHVLFEEPLDAGLQKQMKKFMQETISRVGTDFGFRPRETAEVILFSGNTYDSIDDPRISSGGFYRDKRIRMPFNFDHPNEAIKEFKRVFRHEYTHLVIASLDAGKTPRWLNEGLAVYIEKGREGRKRGDGRAFYNKMKRIGIEPDAGSYFARNAVSQYQSGAEFYEHAYVVTKYLVDLYGFSRIRSLLKQMKDGASFNQAFSDTYNKLTLKELGKKAYQS